MRVTLDVQALVQGTISPKGATGLLISSWERGETTLALCEEIVAEYEEVLNRPRIKDRFSHITTTTISALSAALRAGSTLVTLTEIPRVVPEDPDDDVILACAAAGNAEFIVTRDQHLLRMGTHQGIPIGSAESFARILRGQVSETEAAYLARSR